MEKRSGTRTPSRYVVLGAGAFTAMGCGAIYMWSIFNKPLMEMFGYTTSEVSLVYSLFLLFSLVGSIVAGWLQNHVQSRYIVLFGGMIFGIGWFGSGFADSLPLLYLFFSGFAGSGNGFLYNTIVAVVTKWFPDRRGFANGICIGAIGISSFVFAPLGNLLIESFDVQTAFHVVGIIWIVIYGVCSWLLVTPPKGWMPADSGKQGGKAAGKQVERVGTGDAAGRGETDGTAPAQAASGEAAASGETPAPRAPLQRNYTTRQMLRTPLFYCLFFTMLVATTSGHMISGHASNIGQSLAGLTAAQAAIMISANAVGSTAGRFGFGFVSDYLGRYPTLAVVLGLNAVTMLLILPAATSFVPFLVGMCLVGACFGGAMTVIPAMVGDAFGSENFGLNYSLVYAGLTVASFVGPSAAAIAAETAGTYVPAFFLAGTLSLIGIALVLACSHFDRKLRENPIA